MAVLSASRRAPGGYVWFSRLALALVYGWFGGLKLIDASPANPLIVSLLTQLTPFVTFVYVIRALGVFEVLIGLAAAIPRANRLAAWLIVPHLIITTLPLFVVPEATWTRFGVPTLEGQYIIKNVLIAAIAWHLAASARRDTVAGM